MPQVQIKFQEKKTVVKKQIVLCMKECWEEIGSGMGRYLEDVLLEALKAAAVSVVKSGFPIAAPIPPKMTTLPFSRWRIARRLMYGSAASCITNVV